MQESRVCDSNDINIGKKVYVYILIFSLIWLMLIVLAPLIPDNLSSFIYLFFSKVCHQDPERSFHLYENKFGVCSRCTGIYAGFLAGTILYPLKLRLDNFHPPSVLILLAACAFLLSDVFLDVSGIMTNTFLSRVLTGFVLGFVLPFYMIPGFVKFFYEVNSYIRNKINA